MPVTLVVGSDSLVGCALEAHLQEAGERVIGTTRRPELVDESHLYLDLSEDVERWACPQPIEAAVVCAGVTKHRECQADPVGSAQVNVEGVYGLAKNLVASGVYVIYLSTNLVFDGSIAYRSADDEACPTTEYGWQKAEVERRLLALGGNVSVVRLTKIVGPEVPLFKEWTAALRNDQPIHPFSDMMVAPLPLSFAVDVLRRLATKRLSGVLQVSGGRDVSYAEAGIFCAKLLGADPTLVQPIETPLALRYSETLPTHTTLNTDRLRSELGMEPPRRLVDFGDGLSEPGNSHRTHLIDN